MLGRYEIATSNLCHIKNGRPTPAEVRRKKAEFENRIMNKYRKPLKRAKLLYKIDKALGKLN